MLDLVLDFLYNPISSRSIDALCYLQDPSKVFERFIGHILDIGKGLLDRFFASATTTTVTTPTASTSTRTPTTRAKPVDPPFVVESEDRLCINFPQINDKTAAEITAKVMLTDVVTSFIDDFVLRSIKRL